MQGCVDQHQTAEDLENYSLGRLATSRLCGLECHLLICQPCRERLNAIEPYNFIHYTREGPFYSRVTMLRTGALFARHWGRGLEGGKEFETHAYAEKYLVRSFSLLFPAHACTARCGATKYSSGELGSNCSYVARQMIH